MSDAEKQSPIDVLNGWMKELKDVKSGLEGLVEKMSTVQLEAMEKGFDKVSDAIGKPFSETSKAVEATKAVIHDMELERNRLQNEAD